MSANDKKETNAEALQRSTEQVLEDAPSRLVLLRTDGDNNDDKKGNVITNNMYGILAGAGVIAAATIFKLGLPIALIGGLVAAVGANVFADSKNSVFATLMPETAKSVNKLVGGVSDQVESGIDTAGKYKDYYNDLAHPDTPGERSAKHFLDSIALEANTIREVSDKIDAEKDPKKKQKLQEDINGMHSDLRYKIENYLDSAKKYGISTEDAKAIHMVMSSEEMQPYIAKDYLNWIRTKINQVETITNKDVVGGAFYKGGEVAGKVMGAAEDKVRDAFSIFQAQEKSPSVPAQGVEVSAAESPITVPFKPGMQPPAAEQKR